MIADEGVKIRRTPISRQATPKIGAQREGHINRITAEQADPAQDEGHHRGLERGATREADAGDVAVGGQGARDLREHRPTDVIDRAAPDRLLEGTLAAGELIATDDAAGTETG